MESAGGAIGSASDGPKALAFYLPQYHPIPENDEWWGPGFTEWQNVTKARPLFPGHYQPHVPADLGYYDLRLPEVREAQAALARDHGITGFVYYHYWFNGKRLLERPFNDVLASGEPDFPFALCWANEEWTRNWDAQTGRVLMAQEYSEADDRAHIRWLLNAFADQRYITIDGRPLMLIYRPAKLPDPKRMTDIWRDEAQKAGFPDLYLCWVESWGSPPGGPQAFGLDASVGFMPLHGKQVFTPVNTLRGHRVFDYLSAAQAEWERPLPGWKRFPSVMVGWDNTARRQRGATLFEGATPTQYEQWLRIAVDAVSDVRPEENYLFIVAWNEWAEGNHLEPDQRYGRAFLEATRAVLLDSSGTDRTDTGARTISKGPKPSEISYEYLIPFNHDSAVANAVGLLSDLGLDSNRVVVDLGAGAGAVSQPISKAGMKYHGLELHPEAVSHMQHKGIDSTKCDLSDFEAVEAALDGLGDVGSFLLLDVLEHLVDPHTLLSELSAWSLKHGEPKLVASVPHIAHLDVGLGLLCGRWDPTKTGLLDSTHLRFYTEKTLKRLFDRTGWRVVARDDYHTVHSDQFSAALHRGIPEEMTGALQTLAETANPNWSVQQFVWTLVPRVITSPPTSFYDAVAGPDELDELDESDQSDGAAGTDQSNGTRSRAKRTRASKKTSASGKTGRPSVTSEVSESELPPEVTRALDEYLTSVGLVVSAANRRALGELQSGFWYDEDSLPLWKQAVLKYAYRSPRSAAVFKWLHSRIRP
jgi:Glycosyltransferase WbsX/Methyltransferase domain